MAKQLDTQQVSLFDKVYADYKEYVNPPLARFMKIAGSPIEDHALGCRVWDNTGRSYLDFCGGYGVFTLGHSHPKVVAAVKRQLDRMSLSTRVFFNEQMALLAKELAAIAPGDLQISFFSNSGTEAVEAALKMARLSTKRVHIVSTHNAYHGKTMGSLTATGRDIFKDSFKPLVPEFEHVPFGDLDALWRSVLEQASDFGHDRSSAAGIVRARLSLVKGLRSLRDGLRPPLTSEPLRALTGAPRAGHGLPIVRLRPSS